MFDQADSCRASSKRFVEPHNPNVVKLLVGVARCTRPCRRRMRGLTDWWPMFPVEAFRATLEKLRAIVRKLNRKQRHAFELLAACLGHSSLLKEVLGEPDENQEQQVAARRRPLPPGEAGCSLLTDSELAYMLLSLW